MCARGPYRGPGSWRVGLRNAFTNWNQPLPLHVKVGKLARNLWIRVSTRSTCCGYHGEPGC